METIQYLLSKIVIVIVMLSIFAFLYWMGTLLVPFLPKTLLLSRNATSTDASKSDFEFFLPTPTNVRSLFSSQEGEYPYGRPVTEEDFLQYDGAGTPTWQDSKDPVIANQPSGGGSITGLQTFDPVLAGFSQAEYVRKLSLYKGARVYGGLSFKGEAKEAMFSNGAFPIYVLNPEGKIVGKGDARISDEGARVEWRKFVGRITTQIGYTGETCTLVFQQQKPRGVRVMMPVACN